VERVFITRAAAEASWGGLGASCLRPSY